MFLKLLKNDLFSSFKKKIILLAISLGAVAICLPVGLNIGAAADNEKLAVAFELAISTAMVMSAVSGLIMYVTVFTDFYKTVFTSAGQLTFALPASRGAIITSKAISSLILAGIVTASSYTSLIVYVACSGYSQEMISLLIDPEMLSLFYSEPSLYLPLLGVYALSSIFMEVMAAVLAITFGALIPRRHKLFIGIAFYFGVTTVASTFADVAASYVTVSITGLTAEGTLPTAAYPVYMLATFVLCAIVNIAVAIASYIVTRVLINKKLSF